MEKISVYVIRFLLSCGPQFGTNFKPQNIRKSTSFKNLKLHNKLFTSHKNITVKKH